MKPVTISTEHLITGLSWRLVSYPGSLGDNLVPNITGQAGREQDFLNTNATGNDEITGIAAAPDGGFYGDTWPATTVTSSNNRIQPGMGTIENGCRWHVEHKDGSYIGGLMATNGRHPFYGGWDSAFYHQV